MNCTDSSSPSVDYLATDIGIGIITIIVFFVGFISFPIVVVICICCHRGIRISPT